MRGRKPYPWAEMARQEGFDNPKLMFEDMYWALCMTRQEIAVRLSKYVPGVHQISSMTIWKQLCKWGIPRKSPGGNNHKKR